jgi:hypothetical protein
MTDRRKSLSQASRLVLIAATAGLALTACKPAANAPENAAAASAQPPLAALALADTPATPTTPAPRPEALPSARPAKVARLARATDAYAFADRADAMNQGFGDAPPDYTFDYQDGEQPWVWQGDDQSMRVVEPLPDGGERYYYYEPGASEPYFVRDPYYSYGYQGDVLVVVYDNHGRVLPPDVMYGRADVAGRYLARAQAIRDASLHRQRQAVARANWIARQDDLYAERQAWASAQTADPGWRAYHDSHQPSDQNYWASERYRREVEAARLAETTHNTQQAQQDWRAAHEAQARAAAAGQLAGGAAMTPARRAEAQRIAAEQAAQARANQAQAARLAQLQAQQQAAAQGRVEQQARLRAQQEQAAAAGKAQQQARLQAQQQAAAEARAQAQRGQQQAQQKAAEQAHAARQATLNAQQRQAAEARATAQVQAQAQQQLRQRAEAQARDRANAQAQAQQQARLQAQQRASEARARNQAELQARRQAQQQQAAAEARARTQAQAAQQAQARAQQQAAGEARARAQAEQQARQQAQQQAAAEARNRANAQAQARDAAAEARSRTAAHGPAPEQRHPPKAPTPLTKPGSGAPPS